MRLVVHRRCGPHEVRDVGDVHAEGPLVGVGVVLDRDRVVEILRVRRIDREGEGPGDVLASGRVCHFLVEEPGCLGGLLDGIRRELGAQAVRDDDRLGLDVRAAGLAKHPGNDALGHVAVTGVMQQLDDDLVSRLRVLDVRVADEHGLVERPSGGLNEPRAAALEQHADEAVAAAFEHFLDLACVRAAARLCLAPPLLVKHGRADAIAGDRVSRLPTRNEQIAVTHRVVGDHEPETAPVEPEDTDDLVAPRRQPQKPVAVDFDTAVGFETPDRLIEQGLILGVHTQIASRVADL